MNEKPVAWQRRLKLKSEGPGAWSSWSECEEGMAKFAQEHGHPENYPTVDAEVRPLYLNSSQARLSEAVKVLEEMADLLEGGESGFVSCSGPDAVWKRLRDESISKARQFLATLGEET